MAKPLTYVVSRDGWFRDLPVIYGKLTKPPYSEQDLWFIHFPDPIGPRPKYVFLVSKDYANPEVIELFEDNFKKWQNVAYKTIVIEGVDFWNAEEECLWSEMPFFVHILPDGTPIRYGLSYTQPDNHPEREVWYVVIGVGDEQITDWEQGDYDVLAVDKVCTSPKFMDRMGSDVNKWRQIAWAAPVHCPPWAIKLEHVPDPFLVFKREDAAKNTPIWIKFISRFFK